MANRTSLGSALGALLVLYAACGTDDDSPGTALDGAIQDGAVEPREDAGGDTQSDDAGGVVEHDASSEPDGDAGPDASTPSGPDVDRSDPKLHEFSLDPKVLDSSIADSTSIQYAQLDTRVAPLGKLVIFLPGANNVPADWRNHGRKLAEYGFHVLIPHYNNRWSTNKTCEGKGSSCDNDTRWEALVGEDTSSAVTIARADSAEGRVVTMIEHLVKADPGGDWGYYFAQAGELAYSKIIIAGISHGAASAGMYAARRPFSRNVMHSSGPAGDSKATKMTPLSEWYGFAHTKDPAYANIIGPWKNFGVPGEPTSVDGQSPPYANSHRLISSAMSGYPHVATCVHGDSPKDGDQTYLYEPVWRYLYGAPQVK